MPRKDKLTLASLISQCDSKASPPKDKQAWEAMGATGKEIMPDGFETTGDLFVRLPEDGQEKVRAEARAASFQIKKAIE